MICERARNLVVGHGAAKDTTMGPVTVPQTLEKIAAQVEDAVAKGGRVLTGGKRIGSTDGDGDGYFFEPTVIADVTSGMRMADEESFGPVLGVYRFEGEEEVVRLANATRVS